MKTIGKDICLGDIWMANEAGMRTPHPGLIIITGFVSRGHAENRFIRRKDVDDHEIFNVFFIDMVKPRHQRTLSDEDFLKWFEFKEHGYPAMIPGVESGGQVFVFNGLTSLYRLEQVDEA